MAKNRKRFVRHFPVLHFPTLLFGPPNSSPAFSVAPSPKGADCQKNSASRMFKYAVFDIKFHPRCALPLNKISLGERQWRSDQWLRGNGPSGTSLEPPLDLYYSLHAAATHDDGDDDNNEAVAGGRWLTNDNHYVYVAKCSDRHDHVTQVISRTVRQF